MQFPKRGAGPHFGAGPRCFNVVSQAKRRENEVDKYLLSPWFTGNDMGFREVVESIGESSIMQIAGIGGVIGGMIYHLICQFPQQKDVLSCLSVIALSNCFLGLKVLLSTETRSTSSWIQVIQAFCLFNSIFVSPLLMLSNLRHLSLSYWRLYTTSTFATVGSQQNSLWAPQIGCYGVIARPVHLISKLHNFIRNLVVSTTSQLIQGTLCEFSPTISVSFPWVPLNNSIQPNQRSKKETSTIMFYVPEACLETCLPRRNSTLLQHWYFRDKAHHSFLRRLCGPSFTSASMNEFEPVLEQYCSRFLEAIEVVAKENGTVDMNDWFNRFSFDVRSHFKLRW